jgi:hypothetical protein
MNESYRSKHGWKYAALLAADSIATGVLFYGLTEFGFAALAAGAIAGAIGFVVLGAGIFLIANSIWNAQFHAEIASPRPRRRRDYGEEDGSGI